MLVLTIFVCSYNCHQILEYRICNLHCLLCVAGPMLENLESTLRVGAAPSVPRENVGQSPATPNFANIQLPSALPTPSRPTTSAVTGQLSSSGPFLHPSIPSGIIARPSSEASAVMGPATKKSVGMFHRNTLPFLCKL